jgi:hypothetical protein
VKYVGDAVLTVFDSADAAVRSALELQEGFTALDIEECGLRVGVHLGEVVEAEDGDLYGDGVNVASEFSRVRWVEELGRPGVQYSWEALQHPLAATICGLFVTAGGALVGIVFLERLISALRFVVSTLA